MINIQMRYNKQRWRDDGRTQNAYLYTSFMYIFPNHQVINNKRYYTGLAEFLYFLTFPIRSFKYVFIFFIFNVS